MVIKYARIKFNHNKKDLTLEVDDIKKKDPKSRYLQNFTPEHENDFVKNEFYYSKWYCNDDCKDETHKKHYKWEKIVILHLADTEREINNRCLNKRLMYPKMIVTESSSIESDDEDLNCNIKDLRQRAVAKSNKNILLKFNQEQLLSNRTSLKPESSNDSLQNYEKRKLDPVVKLNRLLSHNERFDIGSILQKSTHLHTVQTSASINNNINGKPKNTPLLSASVIMENRKIIKENNTKDILPDFNDNVKKIDGQKQKGPSCTDFNDIEIPDTRLNPNKNPYESDDSLEFDCGIDKENNKTEKTVLSPTSNISSPNFSMHSRNLKRLNAQYDRIEDVVEEEKNDHLEEEDNLNNDKLVDSSPNRSAKNNYLLSPTCRRRLNSGLKTSSIKNKYIKRRRTFNLDRDGLKRFSVVDGQVYLGLDVFVDETVWLTMQLQKKPTIYLRDLAEHIWTPEILVNRCIDEKRILVKNINPNSPRKKLEEDKYQLLEEVYEDYLKNKKKFTPQQVQAFLNNINETLKQKIQDLRKHFKNLKNSTTS